MTGLTETDFFWWTMKILTIMFEPHRARKLRWSAIAMRRTWKRVLPRSWSRSVTWNTLHCNALEHEPDLDSIWLLRTMLPRPLSARHANRPSCAPSERKRKWIFSVFACVKRYITWSKILKPYCSLTEHSENKHSKGLNECFPGKHAFYTCIVIGAAHSWPSSSPIQVLLNKLNKPTRHVVIHRWCCHVAPFWEEKILDLHTHSIMVVAMHFRLLFLYQDKKGIGAFVMAVK